MKRMTYVDNEGNTTNVGYERKKPFLKFLLIINIVVPIIVIGFIIYTAVINKKCINVYDSIKKASLAYIKDQGDTPVTEGDDTEINIADLYAEQYLNSSSTDNVLCTGTVKITKYKKELVYTLDVRNCNKCSVNTKYGDWSALQINFPRNKAIVDVIPYYNYYDREINTTKWSKYYEDKDISDEVSKYGIRLPIDESLLPKIPKEATETNIEKEETYYYRYRDRSWKWYDIEGDYSQFSSERPEGYANMDKDSERYTEWTEYSLNYPVEKSYRTIEQVTGYKYYYENKNGKKIYYNSGKYTPESEVNKQKYNKRDEETQELFRYRDKQWRWYNGQKRKYSGYTSKPYQYTPIKDTETEILGKASSWSEKQYTDENTSEYRVEEKQIRTRYRKQYEILSLLVLKKPLERQAFEKKERMSIMEFDTREDKKLEVTYKFKYRKS